MKKAKPRKGTVAVFRSVVKNKTPNDIGRNIVNSAMNIIVWNLNLYFLFL